MVSRVQISLPLLNGILAQLGEHLPYKQRVIGSSPIGPIYKNMARWLNWLERPVHTREVESSSLSLATKIKENRFLFSFFVSGLGVCETIFVRFLVMQAHY